MKLKGGAIRLKLVARALTQSLVASKAEAQKLERDAQILQALTASECGGSSKKKRTITAAEAAYELHERKMLLDQKLAEYVKLCKETKGDGIPTVTIEIDDNDKGTMMYYAKDQEAFKKLHGLTDIREQQVAAAVAAASHAAAKQVKNADASSTSAALTSTSAPDAKTTSANPIATTVEGSAKELSPSPGDTDPAGPKVDMTYSLEIERGGEILSETTQALLASEARNDATSSGSGSTKRGEKSEGTERDVTAKGNGGRGTKGKAGDDKGNKRGTKADKRKRKKRQKRQKRQKRGGMKRKRRKRRRTPAYAR